MLYREARSALVIGNGAYASAPLANPVNDVEAMAGLHEKRTSSSKPAMHLEQSEK